MSGQPFTLCPMGLNDGFCAAITGPDTLAPNVLAYLRTADAMLVQYNTSEDSDSLNHAIDSLEHLIPLVSDTHSQAYRWNWTVAALYGRRYDAKSDPADIHKSISFYQKSVNMAPEFYADRAEHLYQVGLAFMARQSAPFGDIADVESAEIFFKRAIGWFLGSEPPKIWHDLSIALALRYEHLGSLEYLDQAIAVRRHFVNRCSEDEQQRGIAFTVLSCMLSLRFRREGCQEDAEELEAVAREAGEGEVSEVLKAISVASSLRDRFRHSSRPAELDEAVSILAKLLGSTIEPGLRMFAFAILSQVLHERFERFKDPKDQEYSLSALKELSTGGIFIFQKQADLADLSSNMGLSYYSNFQLNGDPSDLDTAIAVARQAIEYTPAGHWSIHSRWGDLGSLLQNRFSFSGNMNDLEESHDCFQRAVHQLPDDHHYKSKLLRYLGNSYMDRFNVSNQVEDLDKAVETHLAAVDATPEGFPRRVLRLSDLGCVLMVRFSQTHDVADLEQAISTFKEAAFLDKGPFDSRMRAAWFWGDAASMRWRTEVFVLRLVGVGDSGRIILPAGDEDGSSFQGFSRMMDLVPMAAWLGDTITVRHETLKQIGVRIRDAADSICLQYRRSTTAVEWLEQGRSVVWRQQLNLRSRFDELRDVKPDLARRMRDVATSLDGASTRHGFDPRPAEPRSDESGPPRRRLAEEWESLLLEARQVPGFERLLQPRQISELQKAARAGPIAILNMGVACHALLVLKDRVDVLHVPLGLSLEQAEQLRADMDELLMTSKVRSRLGLERRCCMRDGQEMPRILQCLWVKIVKPILNALGLSMLERSEPHPRIMWCPTGPLAFLPIHAAGEYSRDEPGHRISDYVVSSYTSTISALLDASNRNTSSELRCLTVSQSETPGLSSLSCTEMEVCRVKQRVGPAKVEELSGEAATVAAVHEAMEHCSWIHLACHAIQDTNDPLKSAFRLADGDLQLQDIIRKTHPHADFAFLSACQTSTGDQKLSDEAVHLAAGMQLAGYRSIIATMWSIGDEDGPLVADEVYAHLLRDGKPDSSRAAHALHHAVLKLQETTSPDERDDRWFLRWVPFIHIGA